MRREVVPLTHRRLAAGWVVLLLLAPVAMLCHVLLAGGHSAHAAAPASIVNRLERAADDHAPSGRTTGQPSADPVPVAAGRSGPSHEMTLVAVAVASLLLLGLGARGRSVRARATWPRATTRPAWGSTRAPPLVAFPSLLCVSRT